MILPQINKTNKPYFATFEERIFGLLCKERRGTVVLQTKSAPPLKDALFVFSGMYSGKNVNPLN